MRLSLLFTRRKRLEIFLSICKNDDPFVEPRTRSGEEVTRSGPGTCRSQFTHVEAVFEARQYSNSQQRKQDEAFEVPSMTLDVLSNEALMERYGQG